jgi:hypothetical protein
MRGTSLRNVIGLELHFFTKIEMIFSCPNLLTYFSGITHRKSISQFEWEKGKEKTGNQEKL